ncbi:unnamed protein product [Rotaria sp. Silwood1]|nr:unnamed protein product [Rotaria sp. Silwood1]
MQITSKFGRKLERNIFNENLVLLFPDGHNFDKEEFSTIPENTVLTVNIRTGQIINQWGNNTFYMPRGLSIDTNGNLCDSSHFCKPAAVVTSNDGSNIYIADMDLKFGKPHDLVFSVNDCSLFVDEIRPNRIDSLDVLN